MKKTITKIMLFLLPFMALVLATTGDSVQLINMTTGERITGSFFTMINDSTLAVCPVLAASLSIFSCILAALYLLKKKKGMRKAAAWVSFAGACTAVLPVVARGEMLLLPNVFFPILLVCHFLVCAFSDKLGLEQKEEPQGRRLERH